MVFGGSFSWVRLSWHLGCS